MKKTATKITLKKMLIAKINLETMQNIKGGSSIPTDFDENTFRQHCPSDPQ